MYDFMAFVWNSLGNFNHLKVLNVQNLEINEFKNYAVDT